ncbi:MAG: aminotransferase [Lachnospiraceae bacterium]
MAEFSKMSKEELLNLEAQLIKQYEDKKALGMKLDMSRGKPCTEQLDLSRGLMDVLNADSDYVSEEGIDVRNYGGLVGLLEARRLMGEMMNVSADKVIVYGVSSLNVMFDMVARGYMHGYLGSTPWCQLDKVKFLCPVPGYDRHFAITQLFGIEMIPIPMDENGPDMDLVEKLVAEDDAIKGIWCVPKYGNPNGVIYSDEVVRRFASMKTAAEDFRLFWDNAYCVHHLYEDNQPEILEIIEECEKAGNPNRALKFASTSKITFPGSGIAAMASSKANLEDSKKTMAIQIISYDKVNQLRHVRFFKDINGIKAHMKKHADILRPKFEVVEDTLERELGGTGCGTWTKPLGGYFISFNAVEGCAKAIVAKCKEAGMTLTGAGATYPYGLDPQDSNIRIAPSYPNLEEMKAASELFALCVKLVTVEKLLSQMN